MGRTRHGYVEQCFHYAVLVFEKEDASAVSEDDAKMLKDSLLEALGCAEEVIATDVFSGEDENYIVVSLGDYGSYDYYTTEVKWYEGSPATHWEPAESGDVESYDSIVMLLDEIWTKPEGWKYEVDEEGLDTDEELAEKVADMFDGPEY